MRWGERVRASAARRGGWASEEQTRSAAVGAAYPKLLSTEANFLGWPVNSPSHIVHACTLWVGRLLCTTQQPLVYSLHQTQFWLTTEDLSYSKRTDVPPIAHAIHRASSAPTSQPADSVLLYYTIPNSFKNKLLIDDIVLTNQAW